MPNTQLQFTFQLNYRLDIFSLSMVMEAGWISQVESLMMILFGSIEIFESSLWFPSSSVMENCVEEERAILTPSFRLFSSVKEVLNQSLAASALMWILI